MRVSEQVLEATDNITPRSALRYRPIAGDSTPPPIVTTASIPVVQRASRPRPADVDDEVEEWQRVGRDDAEEGQARTRIRRTSAVSKTLPKTPRPNTTVTRGKPPLRLHPLLYLGVGMIVMLVFWTVLTLAISWFNATLDDIRYGRPGPFKSMPWLVITIPQPIPVILSLSILIVTSRSLNCLVEMLHVPASLPVR